MRSRLDQSQQADNHIIEYRRINAEWPEISQGSYVQRTVLYILTVLQSVSKSAQNNLEHIFTIALRLHCKTLKLDKISSSIISSRKYKKC